MACSVPHTDDEIQALVQKLIDEDMIRQKTILDLALQFDNACIAKDDLKKAYTKCNDILQENRGPSSQTHEIGDVYLIEKELHHLHLDEEALKEALEEARDEKEREKKIRQKQADSYSYDSDLPLTLVLNPRSSTRVETSTANQKPIKIIPVPAGIVPAAKLLKQRDILLGRDGAVMSTQEYIKKLVEDEDFKRDIENFLKNGKLDQVIAIVKSCSPNMIGDSDYERSLSVGAALILANILVFTHKPSMHYLNITIKNVVKVFRKDTILESKSG
ncbi:protein phosphatase [Tanacetum coccineum]